jgi:RNA polymerase sigma-70 factor (ECF subfamily)
MTVQRIYELHADFVFRTLRSLGVPSRDLADVMQEVFLAVHRTLPGFEGRSSMKTWLFTICRSASRDRRRRAHQRYEIADEGRVNEELDGRVDTLADVEHKQRLAALDAILATMEEEQRLVFVLFEIECMTGAEISEALGVPLGTAYSRLRLARAAFRAAVARRNAAASPPLSRVASKP